MKDYKWRIIDANLNRAREAIRVIEDVIRFKYAMKHNVKKLKDIRNLLGVLSSKIQPQLLRAREVYSDVGRYLDKKYLHKDIIVANFKRLQEALRSIEETSPQKELSNKVRQMRFEAYALEKQITSSIYKKEKLKDALLYVILCSKMTKFPLEKVADMVIKAGADIIQLREEAITDNKLFQLAKKLSEICKRANKIFLVNNRVDIAMAVDADGVHLGKNDIPVNAARDLLGEDKIIGSTVHNLAELKRALRQQPDYISVGPVFESRTKPELRSADFPFIKKAIKITNIPVFCIGGINRNNLDKLLSHKITRVAICEGIISQENIIKETRLIKRKLEKAVS